jgi:pyruvate dehydrogenase E2 component (dihydrolipoamide acetyltransferase)
MNSSVGRIELRVPDIGDFVNIPIVELLIKPGDVIALQDAIVTLESDKATLDVPASVAGRVLTVEVQTGSRVSKGSLLATLEPPVLESPTALISHPVSAATDIAKDAESHPRKSETLAAPKKNVETLAAQSVGTPPSRIYASPSVRRLGSQLGVDLAAFQGTGKGGRIRAQDVEEYVRQRMRGTPLVPTSGSVKGSDEPPPIDYAKYGDVERRPLSRIQQISGAVLARNWSSIPHVTNFDEADVTALDQFRQTINEEQKGAAKLTLLSFLVKACAKTLLAMPAFNASLDGDQLVLKKYVNIGVAVDTPRGLLVPVVKGADRRGILDIAADVSAKAVLARDGKLKRNDMEGGCFTISSLGGIGGTGFTPIINAPELAILGAGKAKISPRWNGEQFVPRLILPLSLSWDHRALDGVAAARFLVALVQLLEDLRRVAL